MEIDKLRRKFEIYIINNRVREDDTDVNYLGNFFSEELKEARNLLSTSKKGSVEEVMETMNSLQTLLSEHKFDITLEKREEELRRIRAEKNKLQNEIWDIKASIMNKAVDGVPASNWASAFTKVGITLITASLTAFGITYAGSISSGNINGITIISISIILAFGICLFGFGANQYRKEEKHRNEIYDRFLSYLELKMKIDDIEEDEN